MKRLDYIVIAVIVLCSLLPFLFLPRTGREVTVTYRGETLYRGRLSDDARITTPDGRNTVVISANEAYMERADCADGLCVKSGRAAPLRPVVCLPNEVVIEISGGEESAYDTLAH